MTRQSITFNGVDLQSSNVITERLEHESADHRDLNIQGIGRTGAKIVDDKFTVKKIRIRGILKDTSKANLDNRVDDLKKDLMNEVDKDLDIAYSTGTRRYVATCSLFDIGREYYHIDQVEFIAEFIVTKPFGKELDTVTGEYLAMVTGTNDSLNFGGSARPLPKIQVTVNAEVNWKGFEFQNLTTEDTITVTHDAVATDVFIIDCDELSVTWRGEEIDYVGVFPIFDTGWNDFYIWIDADSFNIDLKIIYYKLWI